MRARRPLGVARRLVLDLAFGVAVASTLGLAACGSTAPQQPLAGSAARPAPLGPAPTLTWNAGPGFDTTALPALARSGQLVLISIADSDGGRGFPNQRLELRDRTDRIVERIDVMTADEFERLVPDGTTPNAELKRRISAANRRITQLHAEHDFVALRVYSSPEQEVGPRSPIQGGEVVVLFGADHRLAVRSANNVVATVDGTAWLAPIGKRCPRCEPCENAAYLASFYKADGQSTIIVRIAYEGTDMCWEPPDQWHVVSW